MLGLLEDDCDDHFEHTDARNKKENNSASRWKGSKRWFATHRCEIQRQARSDSRSRTKWEVLTVLDEEEDDCVADGRQMEKMRMKQRRGGATGSKSRR